MATSQYLKKQTDTSTTGRKLKPVFKEPLLSSRTNRVLVSFGTKRLVLHLQWLSLLSANPNRHTKLEKYPWHQLIFHCFSLRG